MSDTRGTVKLWDVETGTEMETLVGNHTQPFSSISFSPDGKILAAGSYDHAVSIWDIDTRIWLKKISDNRSGVLSISFYPNKDTLILATSNRDNRAMLWNINTGEKIRTFSGHKDDVWSLSFSPDGKILATGSQDRTVKLWDVETGKELITLYGYQASVYNVQFSPDGKALASTDASGKSVLWDFDLDKLMQKGCEWIGAYLGSHPEETELQQICQPYLPEKTNPKP